MVRKFLICIAPSAAHVFHMVDRLRDGGFSNARIRTFLGGIQGPLSGLDVRHFFDDYDQDPCADNSFWKIADCGFPRSQTERYEDQIRLGKIVICVETENPDEMEDVMLIFQEGCGEDISNFSAAENHSQAFSV